MHFKKSNDNQSTILHEGNVPYLTFRKLDQAGVRHGFSTRIGGVSEGMFATLNLSYNRCDKKEAVDENFRRIGKAIGFDHTKLVFSNQIHETKIHKVTKEDCGKVMKDMDGLATNEPGIPLYTGYADCVPLFFYDPVEKVAALAHSGWRGTVGKIGKVTVEKMEEEFGCDPADILGAVGPSICQDCYEVSEDVIKKFRENYDENLWPEIFYQKENGKYQLNLWKANESVFLESGILPEHIAVTNVCTHCNPDILFSHRTTGNERGTLSAFLALKK